MKGPLTKAMHRMSGTHVRLRFGCHRMPLIGDLRRSAVAMVGSVWSTTKSVTGSAHSLGHFQHLLGSNLQLALARWRRGLSACICANSDSSPSRHSPPAP